MKLRIVMEVDLDKRIGMGPKHKGKESSTLGFSLLATVFRAKQPTKIHKEVLADFGIEVVEMKALTL